MNKKITVFMTVILACMLLLAAGVSASAETNIIVDEQNDNVGYIKLADVANLGDAVVAINSAAIENIKTDKTSVKISGSGGSGCSFGEACFRPSFSGDRSIDNPKLYPGGSTNVTIKVQSDKEQGLLYRYYGVYQWTCSEYYGCWLQPAPGWTMEPVSSGSATFKASSNDWYLADVIPGISEEIVYKVTMPDDAEMVNDYYIVDLIINETIGQVPFGENTITYDVVTKYRRLGADPNVVEKPDLDAARDAWLKDEDIYDYDLLVLTNEWITSGRVGLPSPEPTPIPVSTGVNFSLASTSPSGASLVNGNQLVASFNATNTGTTDATVESMMISYTGSSPILSSVSIYVDGVKIGEGNVGEGLAMNLSAIAVGQGQTITFDVMADVTNARPGENLQVTLKSATVKYELEGGSGTMETTLPLDILGGVLEY